MLLQMFSLVARQSQLMYSKQSTMLLSITSTRMYSSSHLFTNDKGRLAPLACHTVQTLKSAVKV